jgi:cytochrome c5
MLILKKKNIFFALAFVFIIIGFISLITRVDASDSITKHHLGASYPVYPKVDYGTGTHAALVKRGEYLVKAGDCIACHTDTTHGGPVFAGGLPFKTPFGTFYSPNITPDKETGIGKWSDEDFIRVMQHGIRPDGSYSFPVFPFTYFTKVNKNDLLAIKTYLFSLKPTYQPNRRNDVPWPLSWRFMQLGWRILFFHPGEYKYDPEHTQEWNRGAYLVQGLGHCGMCHTPMNFLGAAKDKYFLTGNFIEGYYAPDITGFGLKGSTSGEIVDVFTQEEMLKNSGKVEGPMAEVDHDSLMYMNKNDLQAIALYLQTVKSAEPKTGAGPTGAGAGKKIYGDHCAVCHGTGAAGAPKLGDVSAWTPRAKQGMDVLFQHAINGFNSMPPKGTCMSCSDDQIKAAVQYLVDQSKPGAAGSGAAAATSSAPPPPLPTVADGKRIYEATCSVCHAQGLLGAPKLGDIDDWAPRIQQNIDVLYTHAIKGYNRMPAKGTCINCTDAEIQAAVLYMVQQCKPGSDYQLWMKR